MLMSIKLSAN